MNGSPPNYCLFIHQNLLHSGQSKSVRGDDAKGNKKKMLSVRGRGEKESGPAARHSPFPRSFFSSIPGASSLNSAMSARAAVATGLSRARLYCARSCRRSEFITRGHLHTRRERGRGEGGGERAVMSAGSRTTRKRGWCRREREADAGQHPEMSACVTEEYRRLCRRQMRINTLNGQKARTVVSNTKRINSSESCYEWLSAESLSLHSPNHVVRACLQSL